MSETQSHIVHALVNYRRTIVFLQCLPVCWVVRL